MQLTTQPDTEEILSSIISQIVQAYTPEVVSPSVGGSEEIKCPQRISISDYTCSLKDTEIQVLDCYKQVNSDICGFHCLFNLLQFTKKFLTEPASLKQNVLDGARFWKCYSEIYNYLVKEFPNKVEVKSLENLGPLERVHMEFILQNYGDLQATEIWLKEKFGVRLFVQPFYFGFGIIQNSEEDLMRIQDLALSLAQKDEDILIMFPLGITIHWSLFVIFRNRGVTQCFYLDSQNIKLGHIFNGDIKGAIALLEEDEKYRRTTPRDEREERRQVSWMHDLKKTIEILLNVINGSRTMEEYVIEGNIQETLNDLERYIKDQNLKELDDKAVEKIYQWFDDEYRPQVISHNLLKPLSVANKLDKEHFVRMEEFKKLCERFREKVRDSGISENLSFDKKLIEDIFKFIEELNAVLCKVQIKE